MYGEGDNKAAFDKGKAPQTGKKETTTMGVGKGKGMMGERNDTTTPTKNANPSLYQIFCH